MKTVCLTLNDFDFIVGPFQSAGANRIVRMVQDTIFKEPQSSDESPNRRMVNRFGHATPIIQCLFDDLAITVVIDHFQLCSQHIQNTQYFIQGQNLLKAILRVICQILLVFKQQISCLLAGSGWRDIVPSAEGQEGKWRLVAITYDPNETGGDGEQITYGIYDDDDVVDVLHQDVLQRTPGAGSAETILLGGKITSIFKGYLDDVRIYNYALTATELQHCSRCTLLQRPRHCA